MFSKHLEENDVVFSMPEFSTYHKGLKTATEHNQTYKKPMLRTYMFKNFKDMCFALEEGVPVPLPIERYEHIASSLKRELGIKLTAKGVLIVKYYTLNLTRDIRITLDHIHNSHELRYDMVEEIIWAIENRESMINLRLIEFIPIEKLHQEIVYNKLSNMNIVLGHPNRYRVKHTQCENTDVENLGTMIHLSVGDPKGKTKWINIGKNTYPIQPNKRTPGTSVSIKSNGFHLLTIANTMDIEDYGIYHTESEAIKANDANLTIDAMKVALEERKIRFEGSKLNNEVVISKLNYKSKLLSHMEAVNKLDIEREKNITARLNNIKTAIDITGKIFSAISVLLNSK